MIPVILFVYARPKHLARTLAALRENRPPLLLAFSDGAGSPAKAGAVAEVRRMIRDVDWCEVRLVEREGNLGLGCSILEGVTAALRDWDAVIVCEDDLVVAPGAYGYLSQALEVYRDALNVMSVTGWTHSLITPAGVGTDPYFDGRAECLFWGTWRRAWSGMETDALTLMNRCGAAGIDIYKYGADLRFMAERERLRNIWAVRLCFLHLLNRGLCVRPPWSMVEHCGWDEDATSSRESGIWGAPPLADPPPIPSRWPEPHEHPDCSVLHARALGGRPFPLVPFRLHYYAGRLWRRILPTRC